MSVSGKAAYESWMRGGGAWARRKWARSVAVRGGSADSVRFAESYFTPWRGISDDCRAMWDRKAAHVVDLST